MKARFAILTVLCLTILGFAQDKASATSQSAKAREPVTSFVVLRTGVRTDSPHACSYHYAEFFQARGKWIYPDVGYIDFCHGDYREIYVGGGRTLYDGELVTLIQEFYFDQALGPAANEARYIQPWTLLQVRLTPKIVSETVYFPYIPINHSARAQHVLERTKMEYVFNKTFKAGAGYAGYKFADDPWENRPFASATISTRAGSIEFWLQKMPGGAQVQVRYELAHKSK